ncbi:MULTISPECIES: ABC transporter permease [Paenibacillus]|uniref:ABC transporter permease n=1 Tax=Paenibacillus campinasensis TaxID=66347 RepID=A0A268EW29_9BACL|nr:MULTISPECIES: ABC transporter permease subunit [Paenibacillus]MUG68467.1 ABC transporter permease subunit [Paenibacillus campinasensis]PAD77336.1 ABC transporter permease [Paenibacillus campinasensis]PAK50323.1 ABC transporter permease [Paenibacillus sp. 7541]
MKNVPLWLGGFLIAFLLFVAFIGPYLPMIDMELNQERSRWVTEDKLALPAFKPSAKNWLGTDKNGVDNLSKLVVAAKSTLFMVTAIAVVRYLIGVPLGLLARKKRGFFHSLVSFMEQIFSFMPPIFAAALLLAIPFFLFTENRIAWAIVILAAVEAGRVATTVQEQANQLSREPFMEAGIALGLTSRKLMRNYYLPALVPQLIVNFCMDMGKAMLLLGQLAIIGIFISHEWKEVEEYTMQFVETGVNWATLLSSNRMDIYLGKMEFVIYPAGAMMLAIIAFNLFGEGLRRHFQLKG